MSADQDVLGAENSLLADALVRLAETGIRPVDVFAEDVFLDLSLPHWRVQETGIGAVLAVRAGEHSSPGAVRVEGLDQTSRGFLLQFEERWEDQDQQWYCREVMHCVVADWVSELFVACTGDWDAETQRRHVGQVRLIRA